MNAFDKGRHRARIYADSHFPNLSDRHDYFTVRDDDVEAHGSCYNVKGKLHMSILMRSKYCSLALKYSQSEMRRPRI